MPYSFESWIVSHHIKRDCRTFVYPTKKTAEQARREQVKEGRETSPVRKCL